MNIVIEIILLALLTFWVFMCIGLRKEGRHKIIMSFGRVVRVISGVRDRIANKDHDLVPLPKGQTNNSIFFLIFWPIQRVDKYEFSWVQKMPTNKIPSGHSEDIIWGDIVKDSAVMFQRTEWTDHHRDRFDYEFKISSLETGEKRKTPDKKDAIENIRIKARLNATVEMMNPVNARFASGGNAMWYEILSTGINSIMEEIVCNIQYADTKILRGSGLAFHKVKDIRPEAPEGAEISAIERLNYLMMEQKEHGVKLKTFEGVDYELADSEAEYLEALRKRSISFVNLQTAKNNASALGAELNVKATAIKKVVDDTANAEIRVKKEMDVTIKAKAEALKNLQFLAEGQSTGTGGGSLIQKFDPTRLLEIIMGLKIAGGATIEKPVSTTEGVKPDPDSKPDPKKGGKK